MNFGSAMPNSHAYHFEVFGKINKPLFQCVLHQCVVHFFLSRLANTAWLIFTTNFVRNQISKE